MLAKFVEWTRKPITWGGYLKLCGIGMLLSILTSLAWTVWLYWERISDSIEEIKSKIQNLVTR